MGRVDNSHRESTSENGPSGAFRIASRCVVGWATSDHLGTSLAADALKVACHPRKPAGPVVFHSDRGSQHTSHAFAALAAARDIRVSAGWTGVRRDARAEPLVAGRCCSPRSRSATTLAARLPAHYVAFDVSQADSAY
ncbi:DDE-type integrase/transposase/recombinase [Streptomyces sp. NBC_01351]|uniref:DDE-type integrase/transposase/recombinase n=1 Tax=Streptomyces sp. NBC_01351 TaxID=2903833 RepID=UPI003FCDCE2B